MDMIDKCGLLFLRQLKPTPMPSLKARVVVEPSEIEIQRLIKLGKDGELYKAPKEHVDWICYRLMPSLVRYGCYPPPYEAKAANDS